MGAVALELSHDEPLCGCFFAAMPDVCSWNHDGMDCKPEIWGVWSRGVVRGSDLACGAQTRSCTRLCHWAAASGKVPPRVRGCVCWSGIARSRDVE